MPAVVGTAIIGTDGFLVGATPSRLLTSSNSGFDGCPYTGSGANMVFSTYLFGDGAIALGNGSPVCFVSTETDRAKRKGSGVDYLINRKTYICLLYTSSRLEENGKIIIIMTRWATGDLAGKAMGYFRANNISCLL